MTERLLTVTESINTNKTIIASAVSAVSNVPADPGVASSIPAWSHSFMEIDHGIISIADSRRVVVS